MKVPKIKNVIVRSKAMKVCSALCCILIISGTAGIFSDLTVLKSNAAGALKINYTESTEIMPDCDCGYTSTAWIRTAPGKDWTTEVSRYTLLLIGIGSYSSGMGGKDCDFDDAFFKGFEGTLESARASGAMVGIRLRYDDKGEQDPEPDSFEQVLRHIKQIGESGILEKYSDVISFVETGMVGSWGEQWGGKYTSLEYKSKVLDSFLNIVPEPIPVTVRTPNTFRQWLSDSAGIKVSAADMGTEVKKLLNEENDISKKAARVGLYNDGYMGSDSDLGTYSDRKGETDWLSVAPAYGGEFSGSDEFRMKYDIWQPKNAISEMYKTHLVRINSNIYRNKAAYKDYDSISEAEARLAEISELYRSAGLGSYEYSPSVKQADNGKYRANWNWLGYDSFVFDSKLDGELGVKCDNSAFYGKNCFDFIRSHLGHRFVIRSLKMTGSADPGSQFNMEFTVENTGFSDAPSDKEVEIILTNGEIDYIYKTPINAKNWKSTEKTDCSVNVKLPESMPGGNWNVYLRISNENTDSQYDNMFCTKLANADIEYSEVLGANLIGELKISGQAYVPKKDSPDMRPAGSFIRSETIAVAGSGIVDLLSKPYTFTENDHYGFTFLYKIEGVKSEIQLGKWYTGFNIGSEGFSSAYTTYGLNTMNLKINSDGYYALSIPFYGCAFNCTVPSISGNSKITSFTFNDSRNYWSADTKTLLNGNSVKITPVGFAEGAPSGYDVTFHLPDGDKTYSGEYGFEDKKGQTIKNAKAVTVLSLLESAPAESFEDEAGKWKLAGFTTKKGDFSEIIDENFIAIGHIELYPYYELDRTAIDLGKTDFTLTNGEDFQGVRYVTDDETMTASVGDGSCWENNSGYSGNSSIIIPAKVTSGGKTYTVTTITDRAFSSNLKGALVPATVSNIGKSAFPETADICFQELIPGDVDGNGVFEIADIVAFQRWLLKLDSSLVNSQAADMLNDNVLNVFDLCLMKRRMLK